LLNFRIFASHFDHDAFMHPALHVGYWTPLLA